MRREYHRLTNQHRLLQRKINADLDDLAERRQAFMQRREELRQRDQEVTRREEAVRQHEQQRLRQKRENQARWRANHRNRDQRAPPPLPVPQNVQPPETNSTGTPKISN